MKFTLNSLMLLSFCLFATNEALAVRGYTRKNGTYVQGHQRSNPNSTTTDNWSHKGNVNPYTGKAGTKK